MQTTLTQSNLGTIVDNRFCIRKLERGTYVFNLTMNITQDSDKEPLQERERDYKRVPLQFPRYSLPSKSIVENSIHYELFLGRTLLNTFYLEFHLTTIRPTDCDKLLLGENEFPFLFYFNKRGDSENEVIKTYLNQRFQPDIANFDDVKIVDGGCLFVREILVNYADKTISVDLNNTYDFEEDFLELIQLNLDEIRQKVFRNEIPSGASYVF